jgi:hypothetical protein
LTPLALELSERGAADLIKELALEFIGGRRNPVSGSRL